MDLSNPSKNPHDNSEPPSDRRIKRSKTSKACNACRRQKSRCERLAGETDACHRCSVIGIPCIFESDGFLVDNFKSRRPRPILPRNERRIHRGSLGDPPLHVLEKTTGMISRDDRALASTGPSGASSSSTFSSQVNPENIRKATTPKIPLSPEALSTVESTLFPLPPGLHFEIDLARFRAAWQRWAAPLTLLQTLVRRNRGNSPPLQENVSPETEILTPTEEKRLKDHFRIRYTPWLPYVKLGKNGTLDDVSPFLSTVIHATAARTLGAISPRSMEHLRAHSLHHVGQVFANPAAYPLVDSLYALLTLILWPLDAADDVALLVHGAKRLASSGNQELFIVPQGRSDTDNSQHRNTNLDHIRLWYAICANESILTLGTGNVTPSPAVEDLIQAFGSASELSLANGMTADILVILQTNLHRIVTSVSERGLFSDQNAQALSKGRDSMLNYINAVHMFLTKLGEWEIEFGTISSTDVSKAVYYAVLELEYHYVCLVLTTHWTLTICYARPLEFASHEVKTTLWSWSVTGIKHAHAIIRLFNTFSEVRSGARRTDDTQDGAVPLPPLALAPDRIFAMVVLAVMFVLRHQVASHDYGRQRGLAEPSPAGFTKHAEMTIRKAIERMGNIGHMKAMEGNPPVSSYDHAASRYVDVLEGLFRIWKEKRAKQMASDTAPDEYTTPECSQQPQQPQQLELHDGQGHHEYQRSANGSDVGPPQQEQEQEQEQEEVGGAVQLDLDLNLLGADLFSDTAATFTWDGLGTLDWQGVLQ